MIEASRLAANPFSTCWIRPDSCSYRFRRPGQLGQALVEVSHLARRAAVGATVRTLAAVHY